MKSHFVGPIIKAFVASYDTDDYRFSDRVQPYGIPIISLW